MSWSNSLAKEYYDEEKHPIKLPNQKTIKGALNREADWDDAHLVVKQHLDYGSTIIIFNRPWKVDGAEGLGMFLSPNQSGFRVYIVSPVVCFEVGDKIKVKGLKNKTFTITKINLERKGLETKEGKIFSLFFQDYFTKTT